MFCTLAPAGCTQWRSSMLTAYLLPPVRPGGAEVQNKLHVLQVRMHRSLSPIMCINISCDARCFIHCIRSTPSLPSSLHWSLSKTSMLTRLIALELEQNQVGGLSCMASSGSYPLASAFCTVLCSPLAVSKLSRGFCWLSRGWGRRSPLDSLQQVTSLIPLLLQPGHHPEEHLGL